jgi:SAM-dependent methyltransferase
MEAQVTFAAKPYSPVKGAPLRGHILRQLQKPGIKQIAADSRVPKLAVSRMFGFEPLVSLYPGEEKVLKELTKEQLAKVYLRYLNITNKLISGNIKIAPLDSEGSMNRADYRSASKNEIRGIMSNNPKNWLSEVDGNGYGTISSSLCDGSRGLQGYASESKFDVLKNANELFEKKGKPIRVLDVGSNRGDMLCELKAIMGDKVETHALSLLDEPHLASDYYHMLTAERMPAEFGGYFDLVVSHRTLEYVVFAHRALENIAKSLAAGGRALVEWSDHRLPIRILAPGCKVVPMPQAVTAALGEYLGSRMPKEVRIFLEHNHRRLCEAKGAPDDFEKKLKASAERSKIYLKSIMAWSKSVVDILNEQSLSTTIQNWGKNSIWLPARLLIERKE